MKMGKNWYLMWTYGYFMGISWGLIFLKPKDSARAKGHV